LGNYLKGLIPFPFNHFPRASIFTSVKSSMPDNYSQIGYNSRPIYQPPPPNYIPPTYDLLINIEKEEKNETKLKKEKI